MIIAKLNISLHVIIYISLLWFIFHILSQLSTEVFVYLTYLSDLFMYQKC